MLLRFGVSNHYSIRNYQEISLVASGAIKDAAADLIESPAVKEKVLPAIVIYGANGSGKTNLLNAIDFLRTAVIESHRSAGPDTPIPVKPFRLDTTSAELPTELDCDFVHEGVRYRYGVSLSRTRVEEEYLFAYPKNKARMWFHRRGGDIDFGRSLRGQNAATFDLTRPNSLFLSAAASNNHEQLSAIYRFFKEKIVPYDELPPFGVGEYASFEEAEENKRQLLDLLQSADFSIADIVSKPIENELRDDQFHQDFAALLEKHLGGRGEEISERLRNFTDRRRKIEFKHRGANGNLYSLPLSLESRGTQTYLNMLAPAIMALKEGQLLIIDELDTSLHSLLARKLVSLFNQSTSNRHCAQLVFTTHDTNLLSPRVLRRDQVWFTDKATTGETHAYPLTEFRTRNTDDFEKGYLEGRFGAIPIIRHFDNPI